MVRNIGKPLCRVCSLKQEHPVPIAQMTFSRRTDVDLIYVDLYCHGEYRGTVFNEKDIVNIADRGWEDAFSDRKIGPKPQREEAWWL